MILKETRLKSLIKEAIKDYIKENITSNKYHFFYIGKDDSIYDGHYQTTIEAKSDKEALKIFLEEFSKIFIANLDDDINKIERYAIGKVDSEDEEDYENPEEAATEEWLEDVKTETEEMVESLEEAVDTYAEANTETEEQPTELEVTEPETVETVEA